MGKAENPEVLVIHGLRVRGRATVKGLLGLYESLGLDSSQCIHELDRLAAASLARERAGRWALINPAGLRRHREVVDAEVAAAGARPVVAGALKAFEAPNQIALAGFSRFQLGHATAAELVEELSQLLVQITPDVLLLATAGLTRFEVHGPRLAHALEQSTGEERWLASPLVDSVHTCWFDLHEDLLTTLGESRSS